MRAVLHQLFLFTLLYTTNLHAGLWLDDEEFSPSESGLYTYKQHRFTVVSKDGDMCLSFVGDKGEVVLSKQPAVSITPPFGHMSMKERIQKLNGHQDKIIFGECWQSQVARNTVLKKLGIDLRTIRYTTEEALDVKYNGPIITHTQDYTEIKINTVSVDNPERVLGHSALEFVPFARSSKSESALRYVSSNGAFHEVSTLTKIPDWKNLKSNYGVEETKFSSIETRSNSSILIPLLGSYDTFKNGYVKIEEDNSSKNTDHPMHVHFDGADYRGVYYKYWNVRKEDDKDDSKPIRLVTLHSSPLLLDIFEGCTMLDNLKSGFYEFASDRTIEGTIRTTLKMLMGQNLIHFDRKSDAKAPLHFIGLASLDPNPESAQALLHFARKVKQSTAISFRGSKKSEEDLRKQGDFIYKFLLDYLVAGYKSPNDNIQFDIPEVKTSREVFVGPYDFMHFDGIGVKDVYPDTVKYFYVEDYDFDKKYKWGGGLCPRKIWVSEPLTEKSLQSLQKAIWHNSNLRNINFASALNGMVPSTYPFGSFMKDLLDGPVETIWIDEISLPKWKKAGLSSKQIQKLLACAADVVKLDISNVQLPERPVFRNLLRNSLNTLTELTMNGVSNFTEGHFDDLCEALPKFKNLFKVEIRGAFLATWHVARLDKLMKKSTVYYTTFQYPIARPVTSIIYFGWSFIKTSFSEGPAQAIAKATKQIQHFGQQKFLTY